MKFYKINFLPSTLQMWCRNIYPQEQYSFVELLNIVFFHLRKYGEPSFSNRRTTIDISSNDNLKDIFSSIDCPSTVPLSQIPTLLQRLLQHCSTLESNIISEIVP